MDSTIIIAIIAGSFSLITAAFTYYFSKKLQIEKEWREAKIAHYKILLSAMSGLAVDGVNKDKANQEFSLAVNTIALIAPQHVVTALMNFHNEIKFSNSNQTQENHDKLLVKLLLSIRKDIGISIKDDPRTFNFHMIGRAPKKS